MPITAYTLLSGSFLYSAQKRRSAAAHSNKQTTAVGESTPLDIAWNKIKQHQENEVVLDTIDFCALVNKINFYPRTYTQDYRDFFSFLRRCPAASAYVSSLLLNKPYSNNNPLVFQDQNLQETITAATQRLRAITNDSYIASFDLFSALFAAGQGSDDLYKLASSTPGGTVALLRHSGGTSYLLSEKPTVDSLLETSVSLPEERAAVEQKAILHPLLDSPTRTDHYFRGMFPHLITRQFTQHPIFQALFKTKSSVSLDELPSYDDPDLATPYSSRAAPTAVSTITSPGSRIATPVHLPPVDENSEDNDRIKTPESPDKTEVKGSAPIATPTEETPARSSRPHSQYSAAVSPVKGGPLDFSDLITPTTVALTSAQTLQVATMRDYLLRAKINQELAENFLTHPDIFYNFLLHANDDEVQKLIAAFPDPLHFFERTRNDYSYIIEKRIDVITVALARYAHSKDDSYLQERLTNFFCDSNNQFAGALQRSFLLLTNKASYEKIIAIIQDPLLLEHLHLADNTHLIKPLTELLVAKQQEASEEKANYVIHYHLAQNQRVWNCLQRNNFSLFRSFIPGADQLINPQATHQPPQTKPTSNFYLARYTLEKLGLVALVRKCIHENQSIDNETAYLIASNPRLSQEFNELGSKTTWWKKLFRYEQRLWTDTQLRSLNPILANIWDNKSVSPPTWHPPQKPGNSSLGLLGGPVDEKATKGAAPVYGAPIPSLSGRGSAIATQSPAAADASSPRAATGTTAEHSGSAAASQNRTSYSPAAAPSAPEVDTAAGSTATGAVAEHPGADAAPSPIATPS